MYRGLRIKTTTDKKIKKQVKKWNFRSSRLRAIVDIEIKNGVKGGLNYNAIRHYLNSKGEEPYKELWRPIQSHLDKNNRSEEEKRQAYEMYKNKINTKIVEYIIKKLSKKIKQKQ